jgi:hypothetical protein
VDNVVYAWRKFHRLDFSTFSRCKGSGVACWWRGKDTWSPLVKKECIIIASPFTFFTSDENTWWLTCVYGPQNSEEIFLFLQELREIRAVCDGP